MGKNVIIGTEPFLEHEDFVEAIQPVCGEVRQDVIEAGNRDGDNDVDSAV